MMDVRTARTKYEAPKLDVQPLRDLPSALASSGCNMSPSDKAMDSSSEHNKRSKR